MVANAIHAPLPPASFAGRNWPHNKYCFSPSGVVVCPRRTSRKRTGSGGRWVWKSVAAAVTKNCTTESSDASCNSGARTSVGLAAGDSLLARGAELQAERTSAAKRTARNRMTLLRCCRCQWCLLLNRISGDLVPQNALSICGFHSQRCVNSSRTFGSTAAAYASAEGVREPTIQTFIVCSLEPFMSSPPCMNVKGNRG